MAAARRYAVASYDRTRIARMLATSRVFALVFVTALVVVLAGFMYSVHGPTDGPTLALFQFVPSGFIHNLGVVVMAIFGLGAIAGLIEMVRRVFRAPTVQASTASARRIPDAAWYSVAQESLGQKRFRDDCADAADDRPLVLRRWFVHASVMWGFIGLLGATGLDYLLELTGLRATGTPEPIWYPVRLLGTLAGAALVYGTSVMAYRRLRRSDRSSARSTTSDWTFLSLLWTAGVTGFVLELAVYVPSATGWGYAVFLLHVGVAMALVLLAPFGKFAHAFYRPVALFAYRLRG
jgi:nitrate reductase gamma subunit